MKVFRGEALLDVIFAAASILLIFLLLLQPGAKNPNYYRQASLVMGCFGAEGGGTWDGRIQLYSRGSDEGADPKLLQQSLKPDFLRSVIRKDIENGAQLFRIALMFDFAGSICMEDVRARTSSIQIDPAKSNISAIRNNWAPFSISLRMTDLRKSGFRDCCSNFGSAPSSDPRE